MTRAGLTVIAAAFGTALLIPPLPAGASPRAAIFSLKGADYRLVPWDYGAAFRCRAGAHIGLLLVGPRGRVWSFAPYDDLARMQAHGCGAGTVVSEIAGVGVDLAAHFAVTVHACVGSCSGYEFLAFAFDGARTDEELGRALGEGGWRFTFPMVTLYVNKGYHECPSHWTRLSYRWAGGHAANYVLQESVTYTSRRCYGSAPKKWPPDPGD